MPRGRLFGIERIQIHIYVCMIGSNVPVFKTRKNVLYYSTLIHPMPDEGTLCQCLVSARKMSLTQLEQMHMQQHIRVCLVSVADIWKQKPNINRCLRFRRDRLGFYAKTQIIFGHCRDLNIRMSYSRSKCFTDWYSN